MINYETYQVPLDHYIAMINSDESGLSDSESEDIARFSELLSQLGLNAIPMSGGEEVENSDGSISVLAKFQVL